MIAAHGSTKRWSSAGRVAGPEVDQVEAEKQIWALVDAGLVRVHERLDGRGDWQPYQWELTPLGVRDVEARRVEKADPAANIARRVEGSEHPVFASVRTWLSREGSGANQRLLEVLDVVTRELAAGRKPSGRLVSIAVSGGSKRVRIEDHREALEEIFGFPLEAVVRLIGRQVLCYGPFEIEIHGRSIDGQWSIPYLALTQDTLEQMTVLKVEAKTLVTVENQTAFEEFVREGLPEDTIAMYTGGFLGHLEKIFIGAVVNAGIERIEHWGDLDVGGLEILRQLSKETTVPVIPLRMGAALLDELPTQPLSGDERRRLERYLEDKDAPGRELAGALLAKGRKAEQEGYYLVHPIG